MSAYETNPNLTAAREGQKATNEGVPLAKANGRPDVSTSATYTELFPRSDGTNFTPAGKSLNDVSPTDSKLSFKTFEVDLKGKQARYVRFVAKLQRGFLFADEIIID